MYEVIVTFYDYDTVTFKVFAETTISQSETKLEEIYSAFVKVFGDQIKCFRYHRI